MKNLLLIVLAAALMSLGWLGVSGLPMLAALVPLMIVASRVERFWRMAGYVALFIALWYGSTVWWVWNATPVGPPAIVIFAWVFTGVPLMVWFFVSKRAPKALSYTVLVAGWMVGEWVYNVNQASFPWLALGNGFARDVWAVQWMEFTGTAGVALWVLVVNILIFEAVSSFAGTRRPEIARALAGVLLPIIVSLTMYWTFEEPTATAKITIAQPNVDPWEGDYSDEELVRLISGAPADADFVVLPEGAMEGTLAENTLATSPGLVALRAATPTNATLVAGATTYRAYGFSRPTLTARGDAENGFYDIFNSAIMVAPQGEIEIYHKAKMVPGAEMMPTWWWIRGVQRLFSGLDFYVGQYGYGGERLVFGNGRIEAGVGICYESVYGEYFSGFVRNGAEVLMVVTNDGWWGDTAGYRQHFDFARLRAIETRRAIARSANTGRSGFISPRGDVTADLGWDEQGVISAEVPISDEVTFYVRFGDYLSRIALLVWGLSLLYYIATRVRRKI